VTIKHNNKIREKKCLTFWFLFFWSKNVSIHSFKKITVLNKENQKHKDKEKIQLKEMCIHNNHSTWLSTPLTDKIIN